jgi:Zn finger protein HypA/HybF involved in hydrogenase expression
MHEYGVAAEIADLALKNAQGRRITAITLRIGDLSGIFIDSLTMYLELIFSEKNLKPPAIAATKIAAVFLCSCGNRYSPDKPFDPCPACSGFDRTIVDGQTCTIESIEVDDE